MNTLEINNKLLMNTFTISEYKTIIRLDKEFMLNLALLISVMDKEQFDFSLLEITRYGKSIIYIPVVYRDRNMLKAFSIAEDIDRKLENTINEIYIELKHKTSNKTVGILLPVKIGEDSFCSGFITNSPKELVQDVNKHILRSYNKAIEQREEFKKRFDVVRRKVDD